MHYGVWGVVRYCTAMDPLFYSTPFPKRYMGSSNLRSTPLLQRIFFLKKKTREKKCMRRTSPYF